MSFSKVACLACPVCHLQQGHPGGSGHLQSDFFLWPDVHVSCSASRYEVICTASGELPCFMQCGVLCSWVSQQWRQIP